MNISRIKGNDPTTIQTEQTQETTTVQNPEVTTNEKKEEVQSSPGDEFRKEGKSKKGLKFLKGNKRSNDVNLSLDALKNLNQLPPVTKEQEGKMKLLNDLQQLDATKEKQSPLDPTKLISMSDEELQKVSLQQINTMRPEDLAKLPKEQRAILLYKSNKVQEQILEKLNGPPLDPKDVLKMSDQELLEQPPQKIMGIKPDQLSTLSPDEEKQFKDKITGIKGKLREKMNQQLEEIRKNDPYEQMWSQGNVNPNWRHLLERTDFQPADTKFDKDASPKVKGEQWKKYLEDNMPKDLDQNGKDKWIRQQLERKHDVKKLSEIPVNEMDDRMRRVKELIEKENGKTPLWKKGVDFLVSCTAMSAFDFLCFNAWPKNQAGDNAHWTYRVVQNMFLGKLSLGLMKNDGPMTTAAFLNNQADFGNDFYYYMIEGALKKKDPFEYFRQQKDGSYKDAFWTTWVNRPESHGFDASNPKNTMNGPELVENFQKMSCLTAQLLTLPDSPIEETGFTRTLETVLDIGVGGGVLAGFLAKLLLPKK